MIQRAAFLLPSLSLSLLPLLQLPLAAQKQARLLRYPHIQGERIAFVHGGDIWTASSRGGRARRITSFDEGLELFPRISPDGKWIAFSGEYSGTRQVYLVAYEGGRPRQLTFHPDVGPMPPRGGYDHLPLDWTQDCKRILIRANRTPFGQRVGRYFLVDAFGGGLEKPLQIPEGGPATFSPDGMKLAYNIISREWRTWKRYRAGRAQDVYIYNLAANEVMRLTTFAGTDNFPMWLGQRIYFTSDRSPTGTLNLYACDLDSKKVRQVTHFTDFDVLFPTRGRGGVIFECGGYLYVMDQMTEKVRRLEIQLADDEPWLRPVWKNGSEAVADYAPSPSAKRALVEYRGEIFSGPAKKGEVRNLTRTPGRREIQPRWSPDGKTWSYLAEAGEDYELFGRDVKSRKERQVTTKTGAWILGHSWSPDAKKIAFADKQNRLQVVDVGSGKLLQLDHGRHGRIRQWSWSADSRWLSYVKSGRNGYSSIYLCPADAARPRQVSTDHYQDDNPTFDPKGRYLYFSSARDFAYGDLSFEKRLYALILQKDGPHPLAPESDEEGVEEEKEKDREKEEEGAKERAKETKPVTIDLDGLAQRLVALPGSPGGYSNLAGVDKGLLFTFDGKLWLYDTKKRERKVVLEGVRSYRLTPDRKKLLYRHKRKLCLAKPEPGQKAGQDSLPLHGVQVRIVPQEEWQQMYMDAWRIMRDWFYDPGMHGVDWRAMREKYRPLVAHASHRTDLDFILGELIGELNCGHTYVRGGEAPKITRVPIGLLGCEFEQEGDRYRISRIFPGENWSEETRSPLCEPGVDARVGDYLIAIDGEEVRVPKTPYHFLENKTSKNVTLLLNDKPQREGARQVVVKPVASELGLRKLAWVQRNRKLVEEMSGGSIGYIHVPNTAVAGHRELFEGFRPQARTKKALIIDDRYNGGGRIPDRMAMALGQPVLNYWAQRHSGLNPTPRHAFEGPMAMLINGYSSSGGDAFSFYFRKLALGKLIGKKTWGGLVGYSGSPSLVDGGGMAVPSFAFVNTEGKWDVEAVGVAPDIEVFDDPSLIQAGREPILEAAVQHLLRELEKRSPLSPPTKPQGPKRN